MKYAIIIEDSDVEFLKVLKDNWKPGKIKKIGIREKRRLERSKILIKKMGMKNN